MPNVDDLLETLHGPISDQLRQREGKRLAAKGDEKLGLDVHQEGNPSIPSGTKKGEPGTEGHPLTPDTVNTQYEKDEIERAHKGGHIEGLDEE